MGLQGSVAVVTGASKGIGLAIARALVAEGARVVAGALHGSPELAALDGVTALEVDLSTPDGPARLVEAAGDRIDVLVNNVGAAPPRLEGFLAITDEMWHTTWNLDLMAAVRATRAALPVMLACGGGSIVNNPPPNARLPPPAGLDYSPAQTAPGSVAQTPSQEVGGRGARG